MSPNGVPHDVLKEGITDKELIEILKINRKGNEKDSTIKTKHDGGWTLDSEPYKEVLKEIEELFGMRKEEQKLI
jgi:hypothetical protein